MTINTPNLEAPIESGNNISVSGIVFFRELHGTTLEVGLKRKGANYQQFLATQVFQVSNSGTINGTFNVPKELAGQPGKTQYLLVFQETSKRYPTSAYYLPMTLK
ncbi:MAG: hypothetical protein A2201_03865 [Alicyclobacillus sp. RIFOXYA1_FULL_53_8]|nr:MAG: hypothetical protein A2201_03865 [Alicyclobacillus sp. RIFOXYA1_FULL_53_8]